MDFCSGGMKEEWFTPANNRTKVFSAGDFILVNRPYEYLYSCAKNVPSKSSTV